MGWLFIGIAVIVYFVPGFIALARKHPRVGSICALNVVLGWTLIGWFIVLVWSLTRREATAPATEGPGAGTPEPPPS
jgi:hypothetical protein